MTTLPVQPAPNTLGEVQIAREHFGFAQIEKGLLEFSGPDAIRFLQNRLSNDVERLEPGQGQLNTALDRQGRIQGVFELYRAEDALFLLVDPAEKDNTFSQIEKFHILEQYQAQDKSTDVVIWHLQGPASLQFLKSVAETDDLPTRPYHWTTASLFGLPTRIINHEWAGEFGFFVIIDTSQAEASQVAAFKTAMGSALANAKAIELSAEAQSILRIEAGLPRFGLDYDFETLLPETGLEREAVSYSKGCYLGQETIARIKTYGMVQKALVGLRFSPDATIPPTGVDCLMAGKAVGTITSACYSPTLQRPIAMAYLGKTERIPGKQLDLQIGDATYQAEVTLLPFYSGQQAQKNGHELLNQGLKLFSDGYDEEAIRVIRQAIEAEPELVEAYEALGVILSRQDRYEEAIALMEQVLQLDSEHVLAHTNLSVYYMKLGDKDKAEEEKAKATMAAFSKKAKEAGLVFDIEAEKRKKEQATLEKIAMFQEALKFNPEDPLGNFGLGSAYLELKRYEEGIEPFRLMLKAQPRHSVAYLALAKCLEGAARQDEAVEILKKGIEVAAAKGDLMPLKDMQARLENLTR